MCSCSKGSITARCQQVIAIADFFLLKQKPDWWIPGQRLCSGVQHDAVVAPVQVAVEPGLRHVGVELGVHVGHAHAPVAREHVVGAELEDRDVAVNAADVGGHAGQHGRNLPTRLAVPVHGCADDG